MESVRDLAREENRTLSEVINELLVEGVQRRRQRRKYAAFRLPSFRMGKPRVNLGDRNALEALIDS